MSGKELYYIAQAVTSGKISGNSTFTKKCHAFFSKKYGFKKVLLTTSCTDALEMAAILLDIQPGDEVICPSYTFVSTCNAFVLRGAKIVFADSTESHPNIDVESVRSLITEKTKAIVVVHYAGHACDMDAIMELAEEKGLYVVEDAAQAIDSFYKGKPLGGIGHLSAFSFHETKNVIAGEGGMLVVNDERFEKRSEIIWEKGTNRSAFFRGEIDKYGWVDVGSSFLPSDIIAAFLYAQLENIEVIQTKRKQIWDRYYEGLSSLGATAKLELPHVPNYATNNAHMFYVVCNNLADRSDLINFLRERSVKAVFHYLSLHKSPFYLDKYEGGELVNCDKFADRLVRLPLFFDLELEQVDQICEAINEFYESR